tara:strand:+ start:856 stop:1476 length:621 start_codon:yes stop_codon:yes gene_type:complete
MVDYHSARWKITIVEEIKRWSSQVLERPSPFFNGLPPCPYARAAWVNNKVRVDFGDADRVVWHTQHWDDTADLIILVAESSWDINKIEEWCRRTNKTVADQDFVLMPFVPGEGIGTGQPDEEANDWEPIVDEDYAMVFIQRLSDVNDASEVLEQSGYYKNCSAEFLKYVSDRRERFEHAWTQQEEGNEEAGQEEAGQDASVHEGQD